MIPISKELKRCIYCKSLSDKTCFMCHNHSKFALCAEIESYAIECFEAGIRYANEAQVEDKEDDEEDFFDKADRLYEERNGK